jgi:hypothetical protein
MRKQKHSSHTHDDRGGRTRGARAVIRLPLGLAVLAMSLVACAAVALPASSAAATRGIAFSLSSTRAKAQALTGKSFLARRTVYVFAPDSGKVLGIPDKSIASVRWYVDDPTMSKPAWNVERNRGASRPKFDLQGNTRSGEFANPLDLGSLADVKHTITVAVVSRTGKVKVVSASFSVRAVSGTTAYTKAIFDDEFTGTSVNQTNWGVYTGPGNLGFGLRRPSAVTVSNGQLVITAQNVNGQVVSGGLGTQTSMLYGQYQFRVETQNDLTGTTSGVVLLYPTSNIYAQGEEDLYETQESRNPLYSFLHALQPPSTPTVQDFFIQKINATRWISETVDVTPRSITEYRNGVLIWTDTNPHVIPTAAHALHIQLDATKSGLLAGRVQMRVSYVRVYQ